MYLAYFGFTKMPFGLTPNTQFFCQLPSYEEALNVLLFALKSGEGLIKISGEVGAGKTLLCRQLLKSLKEEWVTCYIPNPDLSPSALRYAIGQELGVAANPEDEHQLHALIFQRLLTLRQQGKYPVLIVDEAQFLSDEALETLRLLTNLETEEEKLLQIVLFAQPELDQRLQQHQLRQLKQRIIYNYQLRPLTRQELDEYLTYRLIIAGAPGANLFTEKARNLLFLASEGLPRLINILCHKALLSAYGKGETKVGYRAMLAAVKDTEAAKQVVPEDKKKHSFIRWIKGV